MKCTSKIKIAIIGSASAVLFLFGGCKTEDEPLVTQFETVEYNRSLYTGSLFAEELCVSEEDVTLDGYTEDTSLNASALFDVSGKKVLESYQAHEKLYPASVTKIMTALLALEKGNLDDPVTISANADAASFPSDAQLCGLKEGDVWTLRDLVYALLLYSGNDTATAIAEHIGGTEEAFVSMMNNRAKKLMASNTHFTNPHGLHDDDHYTTAYDLYLIFNECIKDDRFIEIIESESYTVSYTKADGTLGEATFKPTNLYAKGTAEKPENVTLIGGKTGTTYEAGCCLILLERDAQNQPYISVVMGAPDKTTLYEDMTALIQKIR